MLPLEDSKVEAVPKVIFLDAMGTLFGIRESVGQIYQRIARRYGVDVKSPQIDLAFKNSFQSAPPLAFISVDRESITQQEFDWWAHVVRSTFIQMGVIEQFTNFSAFMAELYNYFASDKPWYVYPDVIPSLNKWQQRGIQLGVISNFDTRLYQVLKLLALDQFFTSITISSLVGEAKPNAHIFQVALAKHQVKSQQAWHIGDSLIEDYEGAKNSGIRAWWLNRQSPSTIRKNQLPNLSSLG